MLYIILLTRSFILMRLVASHSPTYPNDLINMKVFAAISSPMMGHTNTVAMSSPVEH